MAAYNKFNCFVEDCAEQKHNLATDTLMVMLTNTAPVATNTVKSDIAEIAIGNGYVAGGVQAVQSSSAQTGGLYKLVCADPQITASGGSIGPFRYAVVFNNTHASKPLIGWFDYGAPGLTLTNGNSLVVDMDQVNGLLTLGP